MNVYRVSLRLILLKLTLKVFLTKGFLCVLKDEQHILLGRLFCLNRVKLSDS